MGNLILMLKLLFEDCCKLMKFFLPKILKHLAMHKKVERKRKMVKILLTINKKLKQGLYKEIIYHFFSINLVYCMGKLKQI